MIDSPIYWFFHSHEFSMHFQTQITGMSIPSSSSVSSSLYVVSCFGGPLSKRAFNSGSAPPVWVTRTLIQSKTCTKSNIGWSQVLLLCCFFEKPAGFSTLYLQSLYLLVGVTILMVMMMMVLMLRRLKMMMFTQETSS